MGMAAGAKAAGSADDEGSPVSRTMASSMGDRRRSSGLIRRVAPDTVQCCKNLECNGGEIWGLKGRAVDRR